MQREPRRGARRAPRVALVRPSWEFPANPREPYIHNRLFAPLSLALTAAMLRQRGALVRVVDAHALRLRPAQVAARVRGCDLAFVTSSGLDRWECPNTELLPFYACAEALAREVDQLYLMGAHPTARPRQLLDRLPAQGAICGEPELAVCELVAGRPPPEVQGLVSRGPGGALCSGPPRQRLLDLDRLPLPAFDLLPMARYRHVIMGPRSVMLEGSRGCPHGCVTCLKAMFGPGYRPKSGETMIREVRFAVEQHGARNVTYIDLEFCRNREAVLRLCAFLASAGYGLQWCCSTRADAVDAPLLRSMRAAGCTLVHYGVESGDQQVLDRLGKRLDLGQVERAVRLTREAGMESLAFFMFGLPGETLEQMARTERFARRLAPDYVSYHIFTPYPGTPAFAAMGAPAEPLFPSSTGEHPEPLLRREVGRAMRRFYLRPAFAARYLRNLWRRGVLSQARLFLHFNR